MQLATDFEQQAREALLDEAERRLVGQRASLVFEFVEAVHRNLRAYGERHGYDVEGTIDSVGTPEVERTGRRITITVGWTDEQMARWEFGTSDHHVDGNPVLAFVWESRHDPPQWVREEFDQARSEGGEFRSGWQVFLSEVDVEGLPESRAIRDALNALRRVLQA